MQAAMHFFLQNIKRLVRCSLEGVNALLYIPYSKKLCMNRLHQARKCPDLRGIRILKFIHKQIFHGKSPTVHFSIQ